LVRSWDQRVWTSLHEFVVALALYLVSVPGIASPLRTVTCYCRPTEMILLLGYLASLLSTFVICAAILSAILTVTTANKAPGHPHRAHVVLQSTREAYSHHGKSKVGRAIYRERSTSIVANARQFPEIAGQEVGKP
jgi:hypothetical protein